MGAAAVNVGDAASSGGSPNNERRPNMPPRGNTTLPLFHEVEYDARARKQKRCLAVLTSPKPRAKSIRWVLGQAVKIGSAMSIHKRVER